MAFQDKTDYFGLATDSSGLVLTSSTENKSATVVTAQDEKGDVLRRRSSVRPPRPPARMW